jgi:retinol dehydrogenase-12
VFNRRLIEYLLTSHSPEDFVGFVRSQFTTLPYPAFDFTGQTVIVAGANTGLGLEATRHIVRLGAAKAIIACRSIEKGEAAKKDIEESTERKDVVEVWQVDLGSYESVKEFCARVQKLDRLDAVVENGEYDYSECDIDVSDGFAATSEAESGCGEV